jgi:glycosyltransferase involved in cell wall biosynthesis
MKHAGAHPSVSIGLPVYNGAQFLAPAIESVLRQTYTDFELIISDNASEDETPEICRTYAGLDRRVRYYRQNSNAGAAANFNFVFGVAAGQFFKWHSSDDLLDAEYLEKTVGVLENDPGVVLCHTGVVKIDARGRSLRRLQASSQTSDHDVAVRFSSLCGLHPCYEISGLIRSDSLKATDLIGPYSHSDGVLLAHLSLLGRFGGLPDPLFFSREHPRQSMAISADRRQNNVWFDPSNAGRLTFPYSRIVAEYAKLCWKVRMPKGKRLQCLVSVFQMAFKIRRMLAGEMVRMRRAAPPAGRSPASTGRANSGSAVNPPELHAARRLHRQ